MTEKVSKATAKKTKATTTKKPAVAAKQTRKSPPTPISTMPSAAMPSHEEIARLAYMYWERRGRTHGSPEQDWFCAEQELLQKAS